MQFFDTTLRDGEQTPGLSLTPENKLIIAKALDDLGAKVIEAGFAAVSPGEREAVKLIASEGLNAEVCSAARGVIGDVEAALNAGVDGVNIIIPTSDMHIQNKLGKTREYILDVTGKVVTYAKDNGIMVEICWEDGSRTDMDFLKKATKYALEAGADRITPCDTVGTLTPEKSYRFYSEIKKELPKTLLGVHCHDDFGLAVANSIAGVMGGAQHIHATINGLGERAGNASLEELTVGLELLYNIKTGINTKLLTPTSMLVSKTTGIFVQPNKAIVGKNAFSHESGIHTHAILKEPSTYEKIKPDYVGAVRRIISGKHSGSTGLSKSLREMSLKPSKMEFDEILLRVKEQGDNGTILSDTDLYAIAKDVIGFEDEKNLILEEFIVTTGNKITPTASVKLRRNGERYIEAATGNGPVDATLNAFIKAFKPEREIQLRLYHVEAITGGTDAFVNVEVELRQGEQVITSKGVNEDIVMASVDAYLKGVNLFSNMNKMREK